MLIIMEIIVNIYKYQLENKRWEKGEGHKNLQNIISSYGNRYRQGTGNKAASSFGPGCQRKAIAGEQ